MAYKGEDFIITEEGLRREFKKAAAEEATHLISYQYFYWTFPIGGFGDGIGKIETTVAVNIQDKRDSLRQLEKIIQYSHNGFVSYGGNNLDTCLEKITGVFKLCSEDGKALSFDMQNKSDELPDELKDLLELARKRVKYDRSNWFIRKLSEKPDLPAPPDV